MPSARLFHPKPLNDFFSQPFTDPWVAQHITHEPSVDYMIAGVTALVRHHAAPRTEFTALLQVFARDGLYEELYGRLSQARAELNVNGTRVFRDAVFAWLAEHRADAQRDPFGAMRRAGEKAVAVTSLDYLLSTTSKGGSYAAQASLFVSAYLNGSDAGDQALGVLIPSIAFRHTPLANRMAWTRINPVIRAFVHGDQAGIAKVTTNAARRLVSQARKKTGKRKRVSGMFQVGEIWADIRMLYDGDLDRARRGIYASYSRSRLSQTVGLFNKAAGIVPKRGRKPNEADPVMNVSEFLALTRVAPTQDGAFIARRPHV